MHIVLLLLLVFIGAIAIDRIWLGPYRVLRQHERRLDAELRRRFGAYSCGLDLTPSQRRSLIAYCKRQMVAEKQQRIDVKPYGHQYQPRWKKGA